MKKLPAILLLATVFMHACSQQEEILQVGPELGPSTACQLDGHYQGSVVWERRNSINGIEYGSTDTFDLDFSIACPDFTHGSCEGTVTTASDTISFESGGCGCWCDCNPLVDCGGDPLLGTKLFSFDGDSLLMWTEGGGVDSLSIPGFHLGHWYKVNYYMKRD